MPDRAEPNDLSTIEELENVWIPMPDGVRLAARIWRPKDAEANPVPAILEFLPYRKRDFMRTRDEPMHRYFALHGYASLRVDVRGSGDSDGVLHDEYSPAEHEDAVSIIEWLAAQPWCSGAIGMTGISWGGFNALQVAALDPPGLNAIITLCASDDRYADDAHYRGGCLLNENMQWGSILTLYNALPPDPEIVGARWRDMWKERIDALEPFPALWMQHQWRDAYWKHGSVNEDYAAIKCPVYAIGGWADGYTNSVSRLLANLTAPKKGLIGPWAHNFPHDARPGPEIGYLQEALRWWDHWLKGIDTGIMDEPMMRAWMQDSVPPQPHYEERPGRWIAEDSWPSERISPLRFFLNWGDLSSEADDQVDEASFNSPQTLGIRGGEWCGFGSDGEAPRDQRPDDGGSLVFDGEILTQRLELFGTPVLRLRVKSNQPVAFLVARLCDVHPDGSSLRISYGMLNLCHRDGHESPSPLEPDRWYDVELHLDDLAHSLPAGHHLRLALSTGYWPMIWPSPTPVTLTMETASSVLELPQRPPRDEDATLRPFEAPAAAPSAGHKKLQHLPMQRTIEIDLTTNETVYTLYGDGGEFGGAALARIEEIGLDIGYTLLKRYRMTENEPLSAQTELVQTASLTRGEWSVRLEASTRLTATVDSFEFVGDLQIYENEQQVATREWREAIPRNLL